MFDVRPCGTGITNIGGLLGFSSETIATNSFATGDVTGNTATDNSVGALAPVILTGDNNLFNNVDASVINNGGGVATDQSSFTTSDTVVNLQDTTTHHPVYSTWDFTNI